MAVGCTVELAAHQLHAQCAGLATHQRQEPDVLGNDGRVEQVSLGSVVVHVPCKHLRTGQQSTGSVGRSATRGETDRVLTWSLRSPSALYIV